MIPLLQVDGDTTRNRERTDGLRQTVINNAHVRAPNPKSRAIQEHGLGITPAVNHTGGAGNIIERKAATGVENHRVGVGGRATVGEELAFRPRAVHAELVQRQLTEDVHIATDAQGTSVDDGSLTDLQDGPAVDDRATGVGVLIAEAHAGHAVLCLGTDDDLVRAAERTEGARRIDIQGTVDIERTAAEAIQRVRPSRDGCTREGTVRGDAADIARTKIHATAANQAHIEAAGVG